MKTYQIKWFGTVYKTVEIQATDEDEAMDLFNGHEDDCKIWDFDYTEDIEEDLETLEDCEEAADSWQGLADYTVEYQKYVQPQDYYPHSKRLVSQEVKQ